MLQLPRYLLTSLGSAGLTSPPSWCVTGYPMPPSKACCLLGAARLGTSGKQFGTTGLGASITRSPYEKTSAIISTVPYRSLCVLYRSPSQQHTESVQFARFVTSSPLYGLRPPGYLHLSILVSPFNELYPYSDLKATPQENLPNSALLRLASIKRLSGARALTLNIARALPVDPDP